MEAMMESLDRRVAAEEMRTRIKKRRTSRIPLSPWLRAFALRT
jgi:hypothetical protein